MSDNFRITIQRMGSDLICRWYWKVSYAGLHLGGVTVTKRGAKRAADRAAGKWQRKMGYADAAESYVWGSA